MPFRLIGFLRQRDATRKDEKTKKRRAKASFRLVFSRGVISPRKDEIAQSSHHNFSIMLTTFYFLFASLSDICSTVERKNLLLVQKILFLKVGSCSFECIIILLIYFLNCRKALFTRK